MTTPTAPADRTRGEGLVYTQVPGESYTDDLIVVAWIEDFEARMDDSDIGMVCRFDCEAALRLGEWLIAQAIARGAGRRALAEAEMRREP